jgi:hypothetical protein
VRRSFCVAAVVAVATWVPVASAHAHRPTLDRQQAKRAGWAHVRWSGYRGVQFGEPLSIAARKLHGRVRSDEPRSDAWSLVYPGGRVSIGGSLQWEESGGFRSQNRSGSTVGSFLTASEHVMLPRHTFVGESLTRFRRSLGKGARPQRPEHNPAIGFYLVGPHGRTLWGYGSRETGLAYIGIAESLAGAKFDWGYEG